MRGSSRRGGRGHATPSTRGGKSKTTRKSTTRNQKATKPRGRAPSRESSESSDHTTEGEQHTETPSDSEEEDGCDTGMEMDGVESDKADLDSHPMSLDDVDIATAM